MKRMMKASLLPVLLVALTAPVATPAWASASSQPQSGMEAVGGAGWVTQAESLNPAEATYLIEGQKVTLTGGEAVAPAAPGSATQVITRLLDKQSMGDLDGDGKPDLAVALVQNPGGSGTFYYLAALLADGAPVEATLLGDRVAVQHIAVEGGRIVVDLLTRRPDEPYATPPSVAERRFYQLVDGRLVRSETLAPAGLDPANAAYRIDGQEVRLAGGRSESPLVPGGNARWVVTLTAHWKTSDLNGDGRPDTVAILAKNEGGSGTLHYLAVTLAGASGTSTPVEAVFLGDRIAVDHLKIVDGRLLVEYRTHKTDQPLAATPTVPQSKAFRLEGSALVPVAVD